MQHRTLRKLAYRLPGKLMRASNLLLELRDVLPRTNDTSRYFSDHGYVRSALGVREVERERGSAAEAAFDRERSARAHALNRTLQLVPGA